MRAGEILKEYYDMADDKHQTASMSDTRRPRLTLLHLNKLKKVREMRRFEDGKHSAQLPKIYNSAPSE